MTVTELNAAELATEEQIEFLRSERLSLLVTLAAIIEQSGGEYRLFDKYVLAIRPDRFQVESLRDIDSRCTRMRVVHHGQ